MVLCETLQQNEKYILDLVTFEDVLITYNKNYNVFVNFTLNHQLKGSTLDWIGIFKAGWEKFENFLTFEWGIGEPVDTALRKRRIVFNKKYLQSALPNTSYQFVYISKNLEVLGVSQFFQFVEDDPNNQSFCLNASFFRSNELQNSTGYHDDNNEFQEFLSESASFLRKARPACSMNIPNNWEHVYTSCWRCKSLFEMKNKHNALIEKLNSYSVENEELKNRVNKLETALQNVWVPKTLLEPWDENKERNEFERFVSMMTASSSTAEGFEKGDHMGEKQAIVPSTEQAAPEFDYFSSDASSKELLLKAVIGSQENKIRELNRTIKQLQRFILPSIKRPILTQHTDIVTLVRAEEKMIPEVVELKSSDDERKVDISEPVLFINENRIYDKPTASGDTCVKQNW